MFLSKLFARARHERPPEPQWGTLSYAQEGEDLILASLFEGKRDGFFVDVGACHPQRFSNTFFFHKLGWRGINIDAMPGSMEAFKKTRPGDINIEAAIAAENVTLTYYMFNEPALNGFEQKLARARDGVAGYRITGTKQIKTRTLASILDEYLPKTHIDFLTVDAEGLDLDVLQSNDWSRYRPSLVLAESLSNRTFESNDPLSEFMRVQGYKPVAKTLRTVFFEAAALAGG